MSLPERLALSVVPDPLDSCRNVAALALDVSPHGANAVEMVAKLAEAYCQLKTKLEGRPTASRPRTLLEAVDDVVREALSRHRGDKSKAAAELGITVAALRYRLRHPAGPPPRARQEEAG